MVSGQGSHIIHSRKECKFKNCKDWAPCGSKGSLLISNQQSLTISKAGNSQNLSEIERKREKHRSTKLQRYIFRDLRFITSSSASFGVSAESSFQTKLHQLSGQPLPCGRLGLERVEVVLSSAPGLLCSWRKTDIQERSSLLWLSLSQERIQRRFLGWGISGKEQESLSSSCWLSFWSCWEDLEAESLAQGCLQERLGEVSWGTSL